MHWATKPQSCNSLKFWEHRGYTPYNGDGDNKSWTKRIGNQRIFFSDEDFSERLPNESTKTLAIFICTADNPITINTDIECNQDTLPIIVAGFELMASQLAVQFMNEKLSDLFQLTPAGKQWLAELSEGGEPLPTDITITDFLKMLQSHYEDIRDGKYDLYDALADILREPNYR